MSHNKGSRFALFANLQHCSQDSQQPRLLLALGQSVEGACQLGQAVHRYQKFILLGMIPNVRHVLSLRPPDPVVDFWILPGSPLEDITSNGPKIPGTRGHVAADNWRVCSRRNLGHCWWLLPQQVLPWDVLYPTCTRWPHSAGSSMARHWLWNQEWWRHQIQSTTSCSGFTCFYMLLLCFEDNVLPCPLICWMTIKVKKRVLVCVYNHIKHAHTQYIVFQLRESFRQTFDQLIQLTSTVGDARGFHQ